MDNIITTNELLNLNPRYIPKMAKNLSKSSFWYYTRLNTADKILDSNSFWVSNIGDMNDLDELELHQQDKGNIYALCFCNSNTEKIPMWYLYSGIAGKGAALGFTPKRMLTFLRSVEKIQGVIGDDETEDLIIGRDVQLRFGWIYYRQQSDPNRVFYKNKWYMLSDSADFVEDNYFLKNYPWEYEREFRLLFINMTNTKYKHLIIPIEKQLCEELQLRLAPEMKSSELKSHKELKCIGKNSRSVPEHSKLKIKMDLFRRNKESLPEYLLEYLSEELSKDNPGIKPEALCQLIQKAAKCIKQQEKTVEII